MKIWLSIIHLFSIFLSSQSLASDNYMHLMALTGEGRHQWEIRTDVSPYISYRLGGHKDNMVIKRQGDMVVHNANFTHKSASALLDWHPLAGSFRVSGGIFVTSNELKFVSEPVVDYYFPGMAIDIDRDAIPRQISYDRATYEVDFMGQQRSLDVEQGTIDIDVDKIPDKLVVDPIRIQIDRQDINVDGKLTFRPFAPFFGIGWANKPQSENQLRFSVDLGVMYHGKPRLNTNLNGRILEIDERITEELNEEFQKASMRMQSKADKYKFLPYALINISMQL